MHPDSPRVRPDPDAGKLSQRARWRRVARAAALTGGGLAAALAAYLVVLIPLTPGIDDIRQARVAEPGTLLSADGKVLATYQREKQLPVTLAQVSKHVTDALIATEDRRFYDHSGVDLRRSVGAIWYTLSGDTQGGSTITQQLARNLFPEDIGRERSIHRKLKEVVTAYRIERVYDKQQILETYLNTAPFLYNVVGIEMAARTYFDTTAAQLDVLQSATLIGMLKGTSYYNPVLHPDRAQKRRNVVLAQMVKRGTLTPERYEALQQQPLDVQLNRQAAETGLAPHFAAHARKWLIDWADRNDYDLHADGLRVETTLDSKLQAAAMQALERQALSLQAVADVEWSASSSPVSSDALDPYVSAARRVDAFGHYWRSRPDAVSAFLRETPEYKQALAQGGGEAAALKRVGGDPALVQRLRREKTRLESGFVAIDPASGEVRAWVGGRDFGVQQFDHVAQATRQPGSTFKPFVYGAALERGLSPYRTYMDSAIEMRMGDGSVWRPTDVRPASGQSMTLRDGLVYSKNTITAQVMQDVGVKSVADLAKSMGVDRSPLDPVPSLALGTSPVTLLEMVSAYATIADQGSYRKPLYIRRITDRSGRVLAEFLPESPQRALSATAAIELIDMMRGVVTRGTGTQVRTRFGIVADIAGKTGTTQNNTDGWFILMHPQLVAGAWVGFDDQRVTMRSDRWGQGGRNAALVVGDFYKQVLQAKAIDVDAKFPPSRLPPPPPSVPALESQPDDWASVGEASASPLPSAPAYAPPYSPASMPVAPPQPVSRADAVRTKLVVVDQRRNDLLEALPAPGAGAGTGSGSSTGEGARATAPSRDAIDHMFQRTESMDGPREARPINLPPELRRE